MLENNLSKKMDMEMQYWPQDKVYFMGTLALFPDSLKNVTITLYFYRPYFGLDDVTMIELTLEEYQRDGYIKYEKLSTGEFKVIEINTEKATDDLIEYLEDWRSNKLTLLAARKPVESAQQQKLLFEALVRAFRVNVKDRQRIMPQDVYGVPNSDIYGTPFWELVLAFQLSERPSGLITRIGYDRNMDGLYPEDAQPFVDIKITDPTYLRSLELAAKFSEPISEEDPQEDGYRGLRADRDGSISYRRVEIPFTPKEAAVMRVFMARPEEWRPESAFTDTLANVFDDPERPDIRTELSKLISRTRLKLDAAVHQSRIINSRELGWKLEIVPTE